VLQLRRRFETEIVTEEEEKRQDGRVTEGKSRDLELIATWKQDTVYSTRYISMGQETRMGFVIRAAFLHSIQAKMLLLMNKLKQQEQHQVE